MSAVREVACQLSRTYKQNCVNRYRLGRQYTAFADISAVIGPFTAGVVTAEYACSPSGKVYTTGTLQFHALSTQGTYVVGTIYPLDDNLGQSFVNQPYQYTPAIGDFTSTVPVEGVLYRLCNCRVYGVYLHKNEAITKKYKYGNCRMKVYVTELVFPSTSGQASVGGATTTERWRVC